MNIEDYFIRNEEVPLDKLKPNPKNPRLHPESLIKKLEYSIKELGKVAPIIVDENYNILAGHARLKAAQRLGLETFPVRVFSFPSEKAKLYLISDNRIAQESDWDLIKLTDLNFELKEFNLNLTNAGFDLDELELLQLEPKNADSFKDENDEHDFVIISFRMTNIEYESKKTLIEEVIETLEIAPHIQKI